MWSYLALAAGLTAIGTSAALLAHARRARVRDRGPSLMRVVAARGLGTEERGLLVELCNRVAPEETPPYESPQAFDRCARQRLRERLVRGEKPFEEAEALRSLRRKLGFEDPGDELPFLSPVAFAAPTGETFEGIALACDAGQATLALRGPASVLHPGIRLDLLDTSEGRDTGAPIAFVEDRGGFHLVRLDLERGAALRRRANTRVDANLPGTLLRRGETPEPCKVLNLCRTGARVRGHLEFPRGVEVEFRVAVGSEDLALRARVVWCHQGDADAPDDWVAALEFPELGVDRWSRVAESLLARPALLSAPPPAPQAHVEKGVPAWASL